jgi:restriction system protein
MTIPDYQSIMRPLLARSGDGNEHRFSELVEALAKEFALSVEDLAELLPSGRQTRFRNRVGWARSYLVQAGLLESVARGSVRITKRGLETLKSRDEIDARYLERFKEFNDFKARFRAVGQPDETTEVQSAVSSATPQERLGRAFSELRQALMAEVYDALLKVSPSFFERTVVDLLRAMGYGGSDFHSAQLLGRSGDGGIDGAIKEDKLGLDTIYVQAKKWAPDRSVGEPEIRDFIGALQLNNARKGVFFTTSKFTEAARSAAARAQSRVVLIDGSALADLMVVHGVGVSTASVLEIKRLDSDYFEE